MPSLALACRLSAVSMALRRAFSPPQFLPSSLFGASDQGYWYDNQDLTTMFQDTAGTVPVTAVEQPVGKQLDKSGKGNHRIAPGPTTSRPILRARYNLLTYSEGFSNAAWGKSNISVTDQGGGVFRVQYTQGTLGLLYQTKSVPAGNIKLSFDIKTNPGSPNSNVYIMTAGVRAATITTTPEWQRVEYVGLNNGSGDIGIISASDLSAADVLVRFPDLRFATDANLPPYQRIAAATDYDTVGFPLYIDTDGADDWMRTASTVDFSGSDKITLVQGLHKRNDTPAIFNELSSSVESNPGAFSSQTSSFTFGHSVGSVGGDITYSTPHIARVSIGAPDTAIISATNDISGDLSRIWRNNVAGIDGTADKGTGNFRNDYVYFYARGGSMFRFKGRDYGQFAISRLLSGTERNQVESWLNTKLGGLY